MGSGRRTWGQTGGWPVSRARLWGSEMDVVVGVRGVVDNWLQWRWGELVEEILEGEEGGGGGVISGAGVDVLGEGWICEQRDGGGELAAKGTLNGAESAPKGGEGARHDQGFGSSVGLGARARAAARRDWLRAWDWRSR